MRETWFRLWHQQKWFLCFFWFWKSLWDKQSRSMNSWGVDLKNNSSLLVERWQLTRPLSRDSAGSDPGVLPACAVPTPSDETNRMAPPPLPTADNLMAFLFIWRDLRDLSWYLFCEFKHFPLFNVIYFYKSNTFEVKPESLPSSSPTCIQSNSSPHFPP